VTLSAGILRAAGLIRYRTWRVTIVDRAELEHTGCECYGTIERELDGVERWGVAVTSRIASCTRTMLSTPSAADICQYHVFHEFADGLPII